MKRNKEVQLELQRFEIFIFLLLLPSLPPGKILEVKLTYGFSWFGICVIQGVTDCTIIKTEGVCQDILSIAKSLSLHGSIHTGITFKKNIVICLTHLTALLWIVENGKIFLSYVKIIFKIFHVISLDQSHNRILWLKQLKLVSVSCLKYGKTFMKKLTIYKKNLIRCSLLSVLQSKNKSLAAIIQSNLRSVNIAEIWC